MYPDVAKLPITPYYPPSEVLSAKRNLLEAGQAGRDTLLLFTADHSFDIRVRGGQDGRRRRRDGDLIGGRVQHPPPAAMPRL